MNAFTSSLRTQIERFLAHKRALGFTYHREESFLREFDRFALREQSEFVSENLVRIYLSTFSQPARPQRLTLLHQLARFLVFEEPALSSQRLDSSVFAGNVPSSVYCPVRKQVDSWMLAIACHPLRPSSDGSFTALRSGYCYSPAYAAERCLASRIKTSI